MDIPILRLNVLGHTATDITGTTTLAGRRRIGIGRVRRVEPQHVGVVVVPERQNQNHGLGQRVGHGREATDIIKTVAVTKHNLLLLAKVGRHRVASETGPGRLRELNLLAALDIKLLDLCEGGARAQELRDNGKLLGGIQRLAGAVKVLDAHAVGIKVAAVRVTVASIAGGRVGAATVVAVADVLGIVLAWVGRVGHAHAVGFPNVHFGTAGAHVADASVGVVGRGLPAFDVGLCVLVTVRKGLCDGILTFPLINFRSRGHWLSQ